MAREYNREESRRDRGRKLTEDMPQGLEELVGDLDAGLMVIAVPQYLGSEEGDQLMHHLVLSSLLVDEVVPHVVDV